MKERPYEDEYNDDNYDDRQQHHHRDRPQYDKRPHGRERSAHGVITTKMSIGFDYYEERPRPRAMERPEEEESRYAHHQDQQRGLKNKRGRPAVQSHKKKKERRPLFKKHARTKSSKQAPKAKHWATQGAVGIRRKTTWLCWLLLLGSFSFAVYKNFTAIDTHTVHECQVVRTKMVDTNATSTFVTDFAKIYYAWAPDHEVLDTRQKTLGNYLTDGLVTLNADALRSDISTTATVSGVKIWSVTHLKGAQYQVLYTVQQSIKNSTDKDKDATKELSSTYTVKPDRNSNDYELNSPKTVSGFRTITLTPKPTPNY